MDVANLPDYFHRVTETPVVSTFALPKGNYAVRVGGKWDFFIPYYAREVEAVGHWNPETGCVENIVERGTTITRTWSVQPPNDLTMVCHLQVGDAGTYIDSFRGSDIQSPYQHSVAWALLQDVLQDVLPKPPAREVTAEMVRDAMCLMYPAPTRPVDARDVRGREGVMIDPHTLPALWRRVVETTHAWSVTPPDDDTRIYVLWSNGEVSVDNCKHCQAPWYGTADQTREIGWTTPDEFAAFLTRPAVEVTDVMVANAVYDVYTMRPSTVEAAYMAADITAALREVAP
jgi:hypothetical protein